MVVAPEALAVVVVETSAEIVEAEEVPTTIQIIQIIRTTRIKIIINKIKLKVKNLTSEVQRPVRTSQLMPVLATGRKVARLLTAVIPSSAAGLT